MSPALVLTALILALAPAQSAEAQTSSGDSVARVIRRVPISEAAFSIANEKGETALLLRDSTIVLQMTDRGLEKLGKKMGRETATEPNFLKSVLGAVLAGTVVTMLDHGIEYSLSDLKEARVEKGVLVLESKSGDHIFESVEVNDDKVLTTFSENEARRFAKRVNEARKRLRQAKTFSGTAS